MQSTYLSLLKFISGKAVFQPYSLYSQNTKANEGIPSQSFFILFFLMPPPRSFIVTYHKASPEIAKQLDISTRTVENHRNRLLKKSGAKNTVGLMEYAIQKGYYELRL
jgi:hypothetical protein